MRDRSLDGTAVPPSRIEVIILYAGIVGVVVMLVWLHWQG